MSPPRVLVLAGTAEGRTIAEALAAGTLATPIMSLAGLTEAETPVNVIVRRGGFGGVGGLANYLHQAGIIALIDATHPFAAAMHRHAIVAACEAAVPIFRVQRRPWLPQAGDDWQAVDGLDAGLAWLRARVERVFATLGRRALPQLAAETTLRFLVRGIMRPADVPANVTWIAGRPPFAVEAEIRLLGEHGIQALFVQGSGGSLTADKLAAARALSLPVLLLTPPQLTGMGASGSVAEALTWVERLLTADAGRSGGAATAGNDE